jgi:hypothetical protein
VLLAEVRWRQLDAPLRKGSPLAVTGASEFVRAALRLLEKDYWLRVFPTEETYLQALVIANLLLLPPDPV